MEESTITRTVIVEFYCDCCGQEVNDINCYKCEKLMKRGKVMCENIDIMANKHWHKKCFNPEPFGHSDNGDGK